MKFENLRIVVVPVDNDDNIIVNSKVEDILNCEDAVEYTLSEYVNAQNEGDFIDVWTFLIDVKERKNYTGIELLNHI